MARQSGPSDLDPEKIPSVAVSRDIKHAHPVLAKRFLDVQTAYEADYPGRKLFISCSFRAPEEQRRLYAQGRTAPGQIVTNCDGFQKKSNHNHFPARALDLAVSIGGKVSWDEAHFYPLHEYCARYGLVWGGDWEKFKDYPHIELPKEVK